MFIQVRFCSLVAKRKYISESTIFHFSVKFDFTFLKKSNLKGKLIDNLRHEICTSFSFLALFSLLKRTKN